MAIWQLLPNTYAQYPLISNKSYPVEYWSSLPLAEVIKYADNRTEPVRIYRRCCSIGGFVALESDRIRWKLSLIQMVGKINQVLMILHRRPEARESLQPTLCGWRKYCY